MKRISILVLVLVVVVFVWTQQIKPQTLSNTSGNGSSQFVVIDATGKTIGAVIGVSNIGHVATVAFPFQGRSLPVDVVRSSFQQIGLFFLSSDCTGERFWDASGSPFPATTVSVPGNTLYAQSGPAQGITAASGFDSNGNCFQTSVPFTEAVPVAAVVNLNTFTPPFKVIKLSENEN
jgi:hypothetical protein